MEFSQWFQEFLQRTLDFIPHLILGLIVFAISLYLSVPASRWAGRAAKRTRKLGRQCLPGQYPGLAAGLVPHEQVAGEFRLPDRSRLGSLCPGRILRRLLRRHHLHVPRPEGGLRQSRREHEIRIGAAEGF